MVKSVFIMVTFDFNNVYKTKTYGWIYCFAHARKVLIKLQNFVNGLLQPPIPTNQQF